MAIASRCGAGGRHTDTIGVITLEELKLDCALIAKILERGSDVWIKMTKTGIVILEAGFTKRAEIVNPSAGQQRNEVKASLSESQ